ncbi:hypothetical protein [Mucilaginibacter sp. L196]|uniref:hypothetical protein n=1 Tax=Mucilaginibacter sp. L196 TaxID=1641870 RepID=UPI00131DAD03|nr:hypothetical protein [Mucilaginibacter sp. L196]
MKNLLFLLLLSLPVFCYAQTDTTVYQKKIAYCTVEIATRGSYYLVSIDDGTTTKASDMEIKDSKGKQIKFTSRIAVLDYVTQRGWKLVSSYYVDDKFNNTLGLICEKPVVTNVH